MIEMKEKGLELVKELYSVVEEEGHDAAEIEELYQELAKSGETTNHREDLTSEQRALE